MFIREMNDAQRQLWLSGVLRKLAPGLSLLDVGAGMLRNSVHCKHLKYVSQDFCQYEGKKRGCRGVAK